MKINKKSFSIFFVAVLFLAACSSTRIIGSWKNADLTTTFNKLAVVGLSSNVVAKTSVEAQTAKVLSAKGVSAKGAGNIFNPEMKITDEMKKQVADKLKSAGFDGVLTFALISIDEETSYVPGTTYAPYNYPYYGSYWGYYGYYAPQVYSPGYYVNNKVYTIEANLYDVETGKLQWSARSETTDPGSLDNFSREYAETVVFQMKKDGVI